MKYLDDGEEFQVGRKIWKIEVYATGIDVKFVRLDEDDF